MARAKSTDAPDPAALVKARVLADSEYGKCNDVVELAADEVANGVAAGALDDNPEAVAYAESLSQ